MIVTSTARRGYLGEWTDDAACRGHLDLMFAPVRFSAGRHSDDTDRRWARPGLALCQSCPVLAECRAWSLDGRYDPAYDAIAGGMTYGERMRRRVVSGFGRSAALDRR